MLVGQAMTESILAILYRKPMPMNIEAKVTAVETVTDGSVLPSLPEFESFLREAGFSKSQATAIAGKGLAPLFRSESGSTPSDFLSALQAQLRA